MEPHELIEGHNTAVARFSFHDDLLTVYDMVKAIYAACGPWPARRRVVMSLVQSAKLNGHDPWAYLNDVLTRLPTHLNSRIDELLPHNWRPAR